MRKHIARYFQFLSILCAAFATADTFVPFVIPEVANPASRITGNSAAPISPTGARLLADGEHFTHNGAPVRILGVNNSFGANFPTHTNAEQMAARLAAAGVNSVRLHHMDTNWWPSGIWNPTNGQTIYAPALERLDYFIHQLALKGIWVNLNLHVGRTHSDYIGMPDSDSGYDKIVDLFTPEIIAAEKDFAATLLNHVNPYRGVRYADDPAIAFVEITNEDSFFMWDGEEVLRRLPAHYAGVLQAQYNDWLLAKYGTRSALETAWAEGAEALGDDMLVNGDFQNTGGGAAPTNWFFEQHGTSTGNIIATSYSAQACGRIQITNDDGTGWHLQMNQGGLPLDGGRQYTLTFDAAAASPRSLNASVMMAHDPWGNLGLNQTVDLTASWQSFSMGFIASQDDVNGRVNFAFGGETPNVYLSNVELRPGAPDAGLLPGEDPAAGTVTLFSDSAFLPRQEDRLRFLAETEKAYFDDMYDYIKGTLDCDALVTGTIVFGPLGLYAQSGMDFIDSHAYWRHPSFPGTPWDPANWRVEQDAMTDSPSGAALFRLAVERLAGKPYTVTEYNHSAPNDYQAETVPMLASFAAAQDWDGFWLYSYAHSESIFDDGYFNSFFDIANNPAKLGFVRAAAAMFRDGGVLPLATGVNLNIAPGGTPLEDAVDYGRSYGNSVWAATGGAGAVTWQVLTEMRGAVAYQDATPPTLPGGTAISWTLASEEGVYYASSPGAWTATGHAGRFDAATSGRLAVSAPAFAAVSATPLDNRELERSRELLISAGGRAENTNMQFSGDRRTVGTNWGTAPVRIEAVDGTLELPPGDWTARALNPDGTHKHYVALGDSGGQATLPLASAHATMWYLLEGRHPALVQALNLDIGSHTARLLANLNDSGGAAGTVDLYWGPSDGGTTPGAWAQVQRVVFSTEMEFYQTLTGLLPNGTYYYRMRTTNNAGEDWSGVETFVARDNSLVWVQFGYGGFEAGSESQPFASLGGAAEIVAPAGTVRVKSGNAAGALVLDTAMRIEASGGVVRIGQ